jgi:hypothetical protein
MTGTPKVFIPNKGAHDYSDALRFGTIEYVTTLNVNRYSVGTMLRVWHKALKNSDKDDYILITSLTILCCIGCALFAMKHRQLNILLFRNDKYLSRRLFLDQIEEELDKEI